MNFIIEENWDYTSSVSPSASLVVAEMASTGSGAASLNRVGSK